MRALVKAFARALARLRTPISAGQALILFVFVVVVAIIGGHALAKVELQGERNCRTVNAAAMKHNKLIDTLLANAVASQQLTDAEKLKRLHQYGDALHDTTVRCPELAIW